jgi:DNA mismatch repair protein MutS
VYGEERAKKPLSPVMRQYQDAKTAYPDAILFFRMGDFYEMFHDDAVVASRALELTLTSRNKGASEEVPMAGVPHHAAAGYVARLLALGHKVAICEQMADPAKTRGIVPRAVVRVLTPGLITDGEQLDGRVNHYLCAVDHLPNVAGMANAQADAPLGRGALGLSLLDLSTGELAAARIPDAASLVGELVRLDPRELLLAEQLADLADLVRLAVPKATVRIDDPLAPAETAEVLAEVMGEEAARDGRRSLSDEALGAAARVLRFAQRCNPGVALPVRRIAAWDPSATLQIDEVAQSHLELVRAADGGRAGSLLAVIDETCSPPGARLLRRFVLAPLLDVGAIRRRLDAVEAFVQNPLARDEVRAHLQKLGDLERLGVRAALGEATPRDLGALRDGLQAVPLVTAALAKIPDTSARDALGLGDDPPDTLPELAALLTRSLAERPPPNARDGGIFRAGYDAELDETRRLKEQGTQLILELETKLRASSSIPTLKIRYTRVFGWYIEVSRSHAAKAPASFRRKQTVAGGERYSNDELDELQERILHADVQHQERELELYKALVADVGRQGDAIRRLANRLASWDVFASLAEVAHRRDYVRPEIDAEGPIAIEEGRHPVVETLAAAGQFVPNDVCLDVEQERLWLLTGPNMAGKSTLMRQVALTVILAQMGSYVPAKRARVGLVDRVLSRVGASDNVARGESTFMVEMRETSNILKRATRRSLVVLDEIGRGTSTYDGLAIAWAVAEHLHDVVGCRALFATHYHELTELAATRAHVANYSVSAREVGQDIVFFHKIAKGAASRSYGVAVARLAGLPELVLARARAILSSLEGGAAATPDKPSSGRTRAQRDRLQLDLFAQAAPVDAAAAEAIAMVRALEIDRLTPLEALTLLAKLQTMLRSG